MEATRCPIMIEVTAWVIGPLAVHASVAVKGLTITHVPSGQCIQSRLNQKAEALEAVHRLLQLHDCDWYSQTPITEANKEVILKIVNEVPKRYTRRAGRPTTDRKVSTITVPTIKEVPMRFTTESRYLANSDISDKDDTIVTIKAHAKEAVGMGKDMEEKFVLYFQEFRKGLILNKTNGNTLIRLLNTEEMSEWTGRKIALYVKPDVEFQGQIQKAIRVRLELPSEPKPKTVPPVSEEKNGQSRPFSPSTFMAAINRAQSPDELWVLSGTLNGAVISEDDRASLYKFVFQRLNELETAAN